MPVSACPKFQNRRFLDTGHKRLASGGKFENHNSYFISIVKVKAGGKPPRFRFHRSVNFYFTDESEPSLVSTLGQFLFYRRVGTVTRLNARSIFILPTSQNRHSSHHADISAFIVYSIILTLSRV